MISVINFIQPESASFLVDIIIWITGITSSIAAGIILFTVLLKLITLPFDFFSKVSMKKNAIKMEEMRPELEKLQKQYADNKSLYSQKMMALYKKNGYSMWGSCLPTILMLVIFIIAINAFTNYSKYQNLVYFYNMSNSYNNAIYAGMELDESEENKRIYRDENGKLVFDHEYFIENGASSVIKVGENETYPVDVVVNTDSYSLTTADSYIKATFNYSKDGDKYIIGTQKFEVIKENLVNNEKLASEENNFLKYDGKEFSGTTNEEAKEFLLDICETKSAEKFRQENNKFLWVKNIWITDSPLSHPVESDWSKFKQNNGYDDMASTDNVGEEEYNSLIAKLEYEREAPNGYFILAILTAGFSFLMQFVTTKTQKAQMELQTVDGQGARTQKMMMWMMPIMMAFFSFMYTSAFSIYMIISSVISIGSTLLIDWAVGKKYKNIQAKKDSGKVRGRIYSAEEMKKQEDKKREEKEKKEEKEIEKQAIKEGKGDFIPQKEVKKHIRGRLK